MVTADTALTVAIFALAAGFGAVVRVWCYREDVHELVEQMSRYRKKQLEQGESLHISIENQRNWRAAEDFFRIALNRLAKMHGLSVNFQVNRNLGDPPYTLQRCKVEGHPMPAKLWGKDPFKAALMVELPRADRSPVVDQHKEAAVETMNLVGPKELAWMDAVLARCAEQLQARARSELAGEESQELPNTLYATARELNTVREYFSGKLANTAPRTPLDGGQR